MTEATPGRGLAFYLDLYRAQLKVGMALMLQYRFAVLIWGVWGFVGPLISLAVWSAATQARGGAVANAETGASFSQADFAAYFLVYMIFSHLTMSWDVFEFGFRIRSGSLSPHLLKPVHPIHADAASNISFKVVTSSMLLPAWIVLFFLLKPSLTVTPASALLAVPAVLLAGVMRYLWQYALAAVAFWTTRVEAVNQLWFTLDAFLAGRIAPLVLLPGLLGTVAYYSPFRSMAAFPVELFLGRIPPEQVLPGFVLQLFWLAVGVGFFRLMWNAGIKQYSAVGA